MRIARDPGGARHDDTDREVGVLVYTYDPAEQALAGAMYKWCDYVFGDNGAGSCSTRQSNVERQGYRYASSHCSGFDLCCSRRTMRLFLNSWRKFFDWPADLVEIDDYIGRAESR